MQWMHDDEERREHREGHKVTVRIIIKLIMKQHKMLNPTKKKQNVPHPLRQHRKTSSLFSMVSSFPVLLFILGVVSLGTTARAQQQEVDEKNDRRRLLPFLDRFTYEETTTLRSDGYHDYAPQDWNTIACPNSDDECIAYQDKWQTGRDWELAQNNIDDDWIIAKNKQENNHGGNACLHCPPTRAGRKRCGRRHHQSPINLQRKFGLELGTHKKARECIDLHWMKYEESFCTLEQLIAAEAFTIERHALRIAQPIAVYHDMADDKDGVPDGVRSLCRRPGHGSRFGRIDYSKGFSDWWYLSHTDVHVPSEHKQEGKTYDAEIQLQHFYSVPHWNEMGTVSIFMNAYEDAPVYPYLDKVICQWRRHEAKRRTDCGLKISKIESYPGCGSRDEVRNRTVRRRMSNEEFGRSGMHTADSDPKERNDPHHDQRFSTVADVYLFNERHQHDTDHKNIRIDLHENDKTPADSDSDWNSWFQHEAKKMNENDDLYQDLKQNQHGGNHTDALHHQFTRSLLEEEEGNEKSNDWFDYWPMLGVRTEYYYRYEGTQTIPPCHGKAIPGTRRNTNHWRVMKDPIRIHPRQLLELQRLLAARIAPREDPVVPCQPDTAAQVATNVVEQKNTTTVKAARPIAYTTKAHYETFCECKDWKSKWQEDQNWCKIDSIHERFYHKPYNFMSDGF